MHEPRGRQIQDSTFTIFCDHKPSMCAFQKKTEKPSPRQARQLDLISQCSTNIQYINVINNVPADMLSWIATISCKTIESSVLATAQANDPDLQRLKQERKFAFQEIQDPLSAQHLYYETTLRRNRLCIPYPHRRIFEFSHNIADPVTLSGYKHSLLCYLHCGTKWKKT